MSKPHPASRKDHASKHRAGRHRADDGSARLAECYLRAMHAYTGADTTLKASALANNAWEPRDEEAAHRLLQRAHRPDLPAHAPTPTLIEALKEISRDRLHGAPLSQDLPDVVDYEQLLNETVQTADLHKQGLSTSERHAVDQLHPLQRLSAIEAIGTLKAGHVPFVITAAHRAPRDQDPLVRKGDSYAPEGYSMHGIGMALDIVPANRRGAADWKAAPQRWQAIEGVMTQCGFATVGDWDKPHYQTAIDAHQAVHLPELPSGWKMLPVDQLPEEVQSSDAVALQAYRLRHLLTQASETSSPRAEYSMPADATSVARGRGRPFLRQP